MLQPTAYKDQPAAVTAIVDRFLKSDGAVFVVPEYNGSYPGIPLPGTGVLPLNVDVPFWQIILAGDRQPSTYRNRRGGS